MSAEVKSKQASEAAEENDQEQEEEEQFDKGLLLDLDRVYTNAQTILFAVMKKVLAKHDLELDEIRFVKHCACAPWHRSIKAILEELDAGRISEEKLTGEIGEALVSALKKDLVVNPGMESLVKKASAEMACGAITHLDEDSLEIVIEKVGEDVFARVQSGSSMARICAKASSWRMLVSKLSLSPMQCVAVVGEDILCKSSLAVGTRCVVLPDELTSHQDFAGADMIVEKAEDIDTKKLNDLLLPCKFRVSA